jgi:microcystin-dependent protein
MPDLTPKLNLKKPLGNEIVNRTAYNENLTLIDQNAASQAQADEPFYLREAAYYDGLHVIQLTFGPGRAVFLNHRVAKAEESVYQVATPTVNTSYFVYLTREGDYIHNISGVEIPGAILIWKITTGAQLGQISVEDRRGRLCGASARIVQDNLNVHLGAGGSEHAAVSQTVNGFMSATDKTKLDGIPPNPAPAGAMMPFAGTAAPSGWLLCYGQEVSRSTYSVLFAVIGTTYGAGDGSSMFNVPDFRGRTPIGKDNMGGTSANVVTNSDADVLGGKGGEENHALTIAEMPSHHHSCGHGEYINGGNSFYVVRITDSGYITGDTGGGLAHNNMQPWLACNWIIKY